MEKNYQKLLEKKKYYLYTKRIFDVLLSLFLLPFFAFIILLFAALIFFHRLSKSFFMAKRLGLYGKEFWLLKIRSMVIDAEKDGMVWAKKNDERFLPIGKWIRRTRIDEMPQILNILKGEMSWIGPRPERKELAEKFAQTIPHFHDRLLILPGLTGHAQVNGGYDLNPQEKLAYDLEYLEKMSPTFDFGIFLATFRTILFGAGAR